MTSEPGGKYIGHLSPDAKDAKTQSSDLNDFFVEQGIDKSLLYLGGDSTPVNTGSSGGIMHLLEVLLGRRLVRVICELHTFPILSNSLMALRAAPIHLQVKLVLFL